MAIFMARMDECVKAFIPKKNLNYGKPGRPLWMNKKALAKVKNKSEAYKRYLGTREGTDFLKYAQACNQARWECRKVKRNFERSIAKEAKTNPRAFYNYVNDNLKTRTGIANLETANGKTTSDREKAEALNR